MATCRMEPCQRTDHRLDVAIQAQILDLLMPLKDEYGLSVLFITHDFGVVAQIADKVAVMYAGRLLETGDVYDVFDHPAHPYTAGLLKTRPVIGRAIGEPLLEHRLATKADVNDRVAQILEIRAGARARVTATRFCVVAFHGGYMADGRQRRFRARNQPSRASGTAHRVTIHGIIMLMCGLDASSTAPAMVDPNEVPTEPAVVTHDSPSVSERAGTMSLTIRLPVANSGETHRPVRISMTPRIRKLPITMRNTT